jgi:hypothetical protein
MLLSVLAAFLLGAGFGFVIGTIRSRQEIARLRSALNTRKELSRQKDVA